MHKQHRHGTSTIEARLSASIDPESVLMLRRNAVCSVWITALFVGGCADELPTTAGGADGPRVEIRVAPLSLASVTDAEYTIRVTNAANGAGEVVWEKTSVASSQYGDGSGSLSYVGPCDADAGTNSVTLTLEALYEGNGVLMTAGQYEDPGSLVQNVDCLENADVSVTFDITIMREAQQGFFDVAVNFQDIFCSAKLDCVRSGTDDDLELLHNPLTGGRDLTAVIGFACTSSPTANTTYLYMNDPVVSCTGQPDDDVIVDVSGQGNVDLDVDPSANPGAFLFGAAVYRGNEGLLGKAYWNVSLGLNDQAYPALGECTLTGSATASRSELTLGDQGFQLPDATVYPVVEWNVPLTNVTRSCTTHEVNGGDGVETVYRGYLPALNQFTWSDSRTTFRHVYNAQTKTVQSFVPFAPVVATGTLDSSYRYRVHITGDAPFTTGMKVRLSADGQADIIDRISYYDGGNDKLYTIAQVPASWVGETITVEQLDDSGSSAILGYARSSNLRELRLFGQPGIQVSDTVTLSADGKADISRALSNTASGSAGQVLYTAIALPSDWADVEFTVTVQ